MAAPIWVIATISGCSDAAPATDVGGGSSATGSSGSGGGTVGVTAGSTSGSGGGTVGSTGGGGGGPSGGGGSSVTGGGGSATTGTGGAGGSGGSGNPGLDCSLLTVQTPVGALISDFEMGAYSLVLSTGGPWFATNDGLGGVQTPNPALALIDTADITPARGTSTKGIHTTGVGFAMTGPGHWGGGIGVNLVVGGNPTDPVDLSAYRGISFYAKGTGTLHVQAQVPEVTGWCNSCGATGLECFNEHSRNVTVTSIWTQYTITWDQFIQENWGYRTSLNGGKRIQALRFLSPGPVDWDFWIDDVTLVP